MRESNGRRNRACLLSFEPRQHYRIHMRNASDDIHPIPSTFIGTALNSRACWGKPTSGILKDVVMLGGYKEAEIDFIADKPRTDAIPMPPATAHGFRLHDTIRLCMNDRI